jgi:hypothetical protein
MHQIAGRIGVIALIVTLGACAGQRAPSATTASPTRETSPTALASEPSAGASASVAESNAPTPDADTAPVFQNWALATIRVDRLNVRAGRSTQAAILDDPFDLYHARGNVRLAKGDHVFVISNAVWADGYWWLEIVTDRVGVAGSLQVGYVAAGTRADPWVEADNSWCPGEGPSLATLLRLSSIERVGCYSSSPLTFRAYRATEPLDGGLGGACDPGPSRPGWLVCDNINHNWVNRDGGYDWELLLHFDPAAGIAPTGLATAGESNPRLTITGHFDDAAAQSCISGEPTTLEETAAYWACTTLFVVQDID